jgi:hypothetical protein
MKKYAVSYEGWVIVNASSEEQAYEKANFILNNSSIINDGDEGEWELTDATEEDN